MSTKKDEVLVAHEECKEQKSGISRRGFLTGGGALAGTALAGSLLAGCAPQDEKSASVTELQKSKGHVTHDTEICTGCRTCALICVLSHERLISPLLSRNIVDTDVYDAHSTNVLYCQQCDDPKCLLACPNDAMYIDESSGARIIDQSKCQGCQTCLNACIFAPVASRIKYNPETNTCFKCDLCGGEPMCVKRCPLGASRLSWESYTIVRPAIDDYEEEVTEGAIEGVVFNKDYSGPHAGKAQDEKEWALVSADSGVQVVGQITSSEGGELRVKMYCDFYDADGNLLGTSDEHQWCLTMHEHLPIAFDFDTADASKIASVTLVANISYWVVGADEEY